ncbi:hypothetical protein TVAGG3_0186940 [Trichomonas vaginalis G3]|uniref:hypothetical protein n=1 Tax=Trichomonas vaginalis (strain ATCC PRA-98 / G3) TaxID=412133 RepID=UPI0021E5B928|nr:hypothetical protein TVAGG3_0186940 [Trichomonas vaginalis G3]KAI5549704.1 hypothetical protein TVAGG3_0186940 [Trichomonas vaginalis G3]
MVVNQYYQNPAIEEYPFKKIDYENKFYAQASEASSEVTYHEVEYPKHGQFFIRLTRTKREFDIEAGTSVSIYCDDFDGIVAVAKFTNHEKNLLRFGIMNVAFKENGKLILSYEGVFNSKVAFVNFYEMYQNDCQQAIVYGSSSVTFTNTEVTEPGHIQVMSGKCQTLYIFFFYKGTKVRIDETAMFNVEYNFLYGEDTRYVRSNENEFDKPLMIKIDSEAVKDKDITINIENPHAVEKSYLITENSTYKSAISEDLDKYVITLDGENISETEKPEPEPDPEKPDPEKPDPEKPDPEKPEPEKPDPEKSEPENPQPEIPNNEKPETPKDDKQNTNGANKKNTAGIVAGVLVALIVIAAVCIIGFIIYKRRQSKGESEDIQSDENKSEENMDV